MDTSKSKKGASVSKQFAFFTEMLDIHTSDYHMFKKSIISIKQVPSRYLKVELKAS